MGLFNWLPKFKDFRESNETIAKLRIRNITEENRVKKEKTLVRREKIANKIKELFGVDNVVGGLDPIGEIYAGTVNKIENWPYPIYSNIYVIISDCFSKVNITVYNQSVEVCNKIGEFVYELDGQKKVEVLMESTRIVDLDKEYIAYAKD